MEESQTIKERRTTRSQNPHAALELQLQQVVIDFGVESCFVVDSGGTILASSQTPCPAMRRLAGWVPTLSRRSMRRPSAHPKIDGFDDLAVSEFRVGGQRRFMATTGGESTMRNVALFRAILGARRIGS